MTWPTVTELPRRLEPVTRDPFIDSAADGADDRTKPGSRRAQRPTPPAAPPLHPPIPDRLTRGRHPNPTNPQGEDRCTHHLARC